MLAIEKYPELFEDWDSIKNDKDKSKVAKHDKTKYWWTCKEGHSYQVSVFSRIRSGGCKICSKPEKSKNIRKAKLKKGISFAEAQPHLLSQWNYDRNIESPNEVSEKSHQKVWFKCDKGHEWISTPQRRSRGDGCPDCYKELDRSTLVRKQKLKIKGVSLEDEYPELIKEWDFDNNVELPSAYSSGSNEKVGWKCDFGHNWKATIYNRTANLSGCPYCKSSTSKLEVFILTEMRGLFDEVEWRHKIDGYECDIYIPKIGVGIEVDGAYWHDDKLERDTQKFKVFKEQGIRLLRVRDESLPNIEGEVVSYNKQSNYIDLSCELVGYLANDSKEESLFDYIKQHVQIGEKEYKKILSLLPAPTKEKSLAELNIELSKEWDFNKNVPLTPYMFTANSEKKVFWICSEGHSWLAQIKNRHARKSGCPKCYKKNSSEIVRKAILKKRGVSLADKFPSLLEEWDYELNVYSPNELSPGSSIKANWKCGQGHTWTAGVGARTGRGDGCPTCYKLSQSSKATQVRIRKTGTLAEKHPQLLNEWDYNKNTKRPEEYPPGSKKRVGWICQEGHQWDAIIKSRVDGKGKCPVCKSIVMLNPDLLREWDFVKNTSLKPEQVTPGSNKKIWWICDKGHSYQQSTYEKLKGHNACSKCK
jgi:very-short-patch-repair endonuclease/ribosomal protein S17E